MSFQNMIKRYNNLKWNLQMIKRYNFMLSVMIKKNSLNGTTQRKNSIKMLIFIIENFSINTIYLTKYQKKI